MHKPASGSHRPRTRGPARAAVLGSLTIQGHPSQVRIARTFVARTLAACHAKVDSDAATLLTSEIVTNAIQHTKSGIAGGTVTIVVLGVPRGVLIEVIDAGSPDVPLVKGDLYASDGHGLFMVQQLAAQWGYLREPTGTTVWFHLPVPEETDWATGDADPLDRLRRVRDALQNERASASAFTPERPPSRGGPVRLVQPARLLGAVRVSAPLLRLLPVQRLAELTLHLVNVRLRIVPGLCRSLGLLGGHADLLVVRYGL